MEHAANRMPWLPRMVGVSPKIISHLDGGLGSQMRQFALGYCVSQKTGLPLYLEADWYQQGGCDLNGRPNRRFLLLETFPEIRKRYEHSLVRRRDERFICSFFSDSGLRRQFSDYTPALFNPRARYIAQYYSNVQYFVGYEEELRALFRFSPSLSAGEALLKARILGAPNSCVVHIRRGDYVGTYFDVCSEGYYLRAMELLRARVPEVEFFIFCNDESWAQEFASRLPYPVTLITGRDEADPRNDLYLLSLGKHAIIANSGFSWMGAFLRNREDEAGLTVMPSIWHRFSDGRETDSAVHNLADWIRLEV